MVRLPPLLKADSQHEQEGRWKHHYVETMEDHRDIQPVLRWSIMENDMQSKVKMLSHNTGKLRYSRKTHAMNS